MPEGLSVEELIQWILRLMEDPTEWEFLHSGTCVFLPLAKRDDKGRITKGSLMIRRENPLYGTEYNFGLYEGPWIQVCKSFWDSPFNLNGYKFRARYENIREHFNKIRKEKNQIAREENLRSSVQAIAAVKALYMR
jgi:hypothetical protein